MTRKPADALRRADHALVAVLAMFIATVSAAAGAAAVYNPHTEQIARPAVARVVSAPVATIADSTSPSVVIDASNVRRASISVTEDSAMAELLREHHCLADALYFEARGEGRQGEMAVAEVIFHRLRKGTFGHSICNVVYAGAGHPGCQFSFTCNGALRRPRAQAAWEKAQYLAAMILVGQARMTDITGGAISFHATSVSPDWAGAMERTTQIGNHVFYRYASRTHPL